MLVAVVLAGCGGGSTNYSTGAAPSSSSAETDPDGGSQPSFADPVAPSTGTGGAPSTGAGGGTGNPLGVLADGPGLLNEVPDIIDSETLADSGLQVGYTAAGQREAVSPLYLQSQWTYMQSCTGVTAAPPLIVIVDGQAEPFVATDDVIRDILGASIASTSVTSEGTVVQVSRADFDGSLGTPGFTTRAILGRTLWLGADLAERDYPFACARSEPVPGGV